MPGCAPATHYVVVAGDGDLSLFRSRGAAQSRLPQFDNWTAYDISGHELALTGGRHRKWTLGGITIDSEHGRELRPQAAASHNDALRRLLIEALGVDAADSVDEVPALIERLASRDGWDD